MVRDSLHNNKSGASGITPEDRCHLFTGHWVLAAEPPAAVAGHYIICRCPRRSVGVWGPGGNIREADGILHGRTALRPIECVRYRSAGHSGIGIEGRPGQDTLLPAPIRRFSIPDIGGFGSVSRLPAGTLGNDHYASLDVPAQNNLRRCPAIFCAKLHQELITKNVPLGVLTSALSCGRTNFNNSQTNPKLYKSNRAV